MPRTPEDIRKLAKDAGVKIVDLRFIDLPGMWQHFSIPIEDLDDDLFSSGIGRNNYYRNFFILYEFQSV